MHHRFFLDCKLFNIRSLLQTSGGELKNNLWFSSVKYFLQKKTLSYNNKSLSATGFLHLFALKITLSDALGGFANFLLKKFVCLLRGNLHAITEQELLMKPNREAEWLLFMASQRCCVYLA